MTALRIALVGCGKIADDHLKQIQRIPGCAVVGACDHEPLMARQACERFGIPEACGSVGELLSKCQPTVVHITTPPQSHFAIAQECLEHGSHVYVEKPFTLTGDDAAKLIALAERKGLKLTAGHDLQFSHAARRLRKLVKAGYLGGPPVHLESYYCYDLSDARYARVLLADKQHWVRRLPGRLLHNIISHGIARIAEYLPDDAPEVIASGRVSPLLQSLGEREIVDELRVIIRCAGGPSAYFTFSSQMRPGLNHFRIYGPKNGLTLDEDSQTVIKYRGSTFKSYAEKFIPPVIFAGQHLRNLAANLRLFLRNDFQMKSGMKCLIESFYASIREGTPSPIAPREILLTARIMDAIFEQVRTEEEKSEVRNSKSEGNPKSEARNPKVACGVHGRADGE